MDVACRQASRCAAGTARAAGRSKRAGATLHSHGAATHPHHRVDCRSDCTRAALPSERSAAPHQRPARYIARSGAAAEPATSASPDETVVTSSAGVTIAVRPARTQQELRRVADLRAEAYYAENTTRFVGSLKKKFAEQEAESLLQRTTAIGRQGQRLLECLVAVEPGTDTVLGCIDMRLPRALTGENPQGVPEGDVHGCYLLNVVVDEAQRGQGLGSALMRQAMVRAVRRWGAQQLYTHVEADNEVAYRLYKGCGFREHSVDSKYEAATKLGQTVLLQAPGSECAE